MEALTYVKSAIFDYNDLLEKRQRILEQEGGPKPSLGDDEDINFFSLLQSLSIAFFNEGVENEHLKEYEEALQSYEKSRDYAF